VATQRTLVIIKPDGMQRGLATEILGRIERRGLRFAGLKVMRLTPQLAERHYAEHAGRPFYAGLVTYITSFPVIVAAVDGPDAIAAVRQLMGATRPGEAAPGTVRADYAITVDFNLVHGSANEADAQREVELFFTASELVPYERVIDAWIAKG
jgi:nucleoside-diphosphate kinase